MKKLIRNYKDFSLWEIKEENELLPIDQFVLNVYYYHHLRQNFYPPAELKKLIIEDAEALPDSFFYVIYDKEDEIIGTIKLQKWNKETVLSIEKDFKVNLKCFIQGLPYKPKEIFHIGRFAVNQEKIKEDPALKQKRITIMKLLMCCALIPISKENSNIFFCECDEKLLNTLPLLGLHTHVIGKPKVYLGSKTLPVYGEQSGMTEFIGHNKYLSYV